MKVLSRSEAECLLGSIGLAIGKWNELSDKLPSGMLNRSYQAPPDGMSIYVLAWHLVRWIGVEGWVLMQIDNSSAPTEDEMLIFEELAFSGRHQWVVGDEHSFLLESIDMGRVQAKFALLIYHSILFGWHVHFTSQACALGQRIAIQDGVIHFFGDIRVLARAEVLIANVRSELRRMPS